MTAEEFFASATAAAPIVALGLLFWFVLLSVIARISGWTELSGYYAAEGAFRGPALRFQSASMERMRMAPMSLNNVLTLGADPSRLYLAMFLPFRPAHPPLSIAWSDIAAAPRMGVLGEQVEFRAQRAPNVKILLSPRHAAFLAEASGGAFSVQTPEQSARSAFA